MSNMPADSPSVPKGEARSAARGCDPRHNRVKSAAKIALASASILALVSVPAMHLVPNMTLFELALLLAGLFVVIIVLVVVTLTVTQWVLRMGGTDPQWFWFSGEPPGLQQLRQDAREAPRREV